ncbi:dna topoisomerase i [hydrocarbon metagenome]|uniref:Dna topoisomerase i n=1 Tax=hydrocarbon metagenome TaxID=938273 RepID=A0A0W8FFF9_9ZZZZ
MMRRSIGDDRWRIYELIVRRFLATLSPDASWATIRCTFDASGEPYIATGGRLVSAGWRRVYPYSEAKENILPGFTEGERLPILKVTLDEKETQPPPRYSQSRLIQQMEELGLGTKSTRHEVIGKLISRRYVEGNPLRPTLVGRAVTEALENHADLITAPDMTQTLEEHMQQIKERNRTRDDVVTESRTMLHQVFDKLEAHEQEIGDEIMEQTVEERTIGPCPVCGSDLRIRHIGGSQFIGCTRYPDCRFNISLPGSVWGRAIKIEDVCPDHHLAHVRLIRKGAPPWTIGCPLCSHIESNEETMYLMPGMNEPLLRRLQGQHIYSVSEVAASPPEVIAQAAGISVEEARRLIAEAEDALDILRRRSGLRKFVRKIVPPRRGRSHAKILQRLLDAGIGDIAALAAADAALLKKSGLSEKEADLLLEKAREICNEKILKEAGISAVSLKKYQAAGIASPETLCRLPLPYLIGRSGISPETVHKHVEKVCRHLGRPVPPKITKSMLERGRSELLAIPGLGEATLEKLFLAGIFDAETLAAADPEAAAAASGVPAARIRDYKASLA